MVGQVQGYLLPHPVLKERSHVLRVECISERNTCGDYLLD